MNNLFKTTQASLQNKMPRTKFPFNFQNKLSFNAGELVPCSIMEILPGDTVNMNIHSLTRMATPIAPIMDNIKQDFWFFFVPRRLLENNWEDFITYSDWDSLNTSTVRTLSFNGPGGGAKAPVDRSSLAHYMGLPIGDYSPAFLNKIVAAPLLTYPLIWNYYFRDENYQTEIAVSASAAMTLTPGVYAGSGGYNLNNKLLFVNEFHDLFTSVLPSPQKGPQVLLPLGESAPIIAGDTVNSLGQALQISNSVAEGSSIGSASNYVLGFTTQDAVPSDAKEVKAFTASVGTSSDITVTGTNLLADLSAATSASISDLRESALIQHFMEQLARTGSRLQEYYLGFWGVVSPDARLQYPEYIAGTRFSINVSEVLQTAGYTEANDTTLGTTGAVSRTVQSENSLFTKSFVEHGYLICLTAVRHDLSYSQGLPKMFTKTKALDYYVPTFNGLSEQPMFQYQAMAPVGFNANTMKDVFSNSYTGLSMDTVLGFNEPWPEHRFRENRATGMLNPVAKDGLDYWTLCKAFITAPTGASIRVADSSTLARALSTGSTTDQFIMDYYEECNIVRNMPPRSIPGINRL